MAKKSTRLSSKLPLTASGTLPKADVLERWRALPTGKPIVMDAVPAGANGSAYEGDSMRLTGSLKAIDFKMSNLKSLLRFENTKTRLDIKFSEQKEKKTGKPVPGKYVVYIKVVEKVRTTSARAPVATAPARAPAVPKARKPAPLVVPTTPPALAEALEALLVLGKKRPEAEQLLYLVEQQHGSGLDCAAYVTLALKTTVPKK